MQLKVLTRARGTTAKNAIIALHGYGDNAQNFIELADEFQVDDVVWVAAQGPREVPQSFGGARWYDLFSNPREEMENSYQSIVNLIDKVTAEHKLPIEKIFLLGFSQGGFMSLYTALRSEKRFAGVIALSGYLTQVLKLNPPKGSCKNMPFFVGHGLQDQVVLPHLYFETLDILKTFGVEHVTAKTYGVGHTLCIEEMRDIENFIRENR